MFRKLSLSMILLGCTFLAVAMPTDIAEAYCIFCGHPKAGATCVGAPPCAGTCVCKLWVPYTATTCTCGTSWWGSCSC
jgi:hypothetical protein